MNRTQNRPSFVADVIDPLELCGTYIEHTGNTEAAYRYVMTLTISIRHFLNAANTHRKGPKTQKELV